MVCPKIGKMVKAFGDKNIKYFGKRCFFDGIKKTPCWRTKRFYFFID
jgi:hypothetical protein